MKLQLALAGDRKGFRPQTLHQLPLYFPSTPLPSLPSLLRSEKDTMVVGVVLQDVRRGRVKREISK